MIHLCSSSSKPTAIFRHCNSPYTHEHPLLYDCNTLQAAYSIPSRLSNCSSCIAALTTTYFADHILYATSYALYNMQICCNTLPELQLASHRFCGWVLFPRFLLISF